MLGAVIVGVVAVAVVGFIAYKWPAWFGKQVQAGADVVNQVDDKVNAVVADKVDQAKTAVKDAVKKA